MNAVSTTLAAVCRRRFAHLAPIAVCAGALLLAVGHMIEPRERPASLVGTPAPASALPLLSDGAASFAPSQMRGRMWLLNVWASWCAPCRDEHPLLVSLARDEGINVIGLNLRDDDRSAQEWLLRLGDPYLINAADRDGQASVDWGIHGVPQTFVVDASGVIRHHLRGPLTRQAWADEIAPLLRRLDVRATP
jgi:cytochrome c biogenesis protein CcmG/thiol:disulfide interchange protein DsbE